MVDPWPKGVLVPICKTTRCVMNWSTHQSNRITNQNGDSRSVFLGNLCLCAIRSSPLSQLLWIIGYRHTTHLLRRYTRHWLVVSLITHTSSHLYSPSIAISGSQIKIAFLVVPRLRCSTPSHRLLSRTFLSHFKSNMVLVLPQVHWERTLCRWQGFLSLIRFSASLRR